MTLRLYFNGCNLDPDFPPPQSTQHIIVPSNRPPAVVAQRTLTKSRKLPPAQAKVAGGKKIADSSLFDQYRAFSPEESRMHDVADESDLAMPSKQKRDFDNDSSSSSSSSEEERGTDSPLPKKRRAL